MKVRLASALLALTFSSVSFAGQAIDPKVMKKALESDGDVKTIVTLPINSLKLVETKKGKVYFISGNGRFVFKGTLFDIWKRKSIDNASDGEDLKYLKLSEMGIKDSDMALFKIGNPKLPRQGYLILDPTTKNAKTLLDRIMVDQGSYHLDILLVPIKKGAKETVNRLWCAEDKNAALTDLILQTNTTGKQKKECDIRPIYRNMALFSLLDINSVPIIVREDGYKLVGIPKDLKGFLLNKDKNQNEKK